ncbi:MAG: hypothetical protein IKD78_13875, partial [Bacteroidales bacterium]|nr:hypothetical protein [Bacteroidales bacterium]
EVWYVPTDPIDHLCSRTAGQFHHAAIMKRYLRYLLFSLKTNLSFASRLRIMPIACSMIAGHALLHLLKGNVTTFKSDVAALAASCHDGKRIQAARRQISRIRKVSDAHIFKFAMKRPQIAEFLRYIKGNI